MSLNNKHILFDKCDGVKSSIQRPHHKNEHLTDHFYVLRRFDDLLSILDANQREHSQFKKNQGQPP
jgi:hypothetical protein